MTNLIALANGTLLAGDYRIERVLGAGGFGVTYLAQELALSRQVTIKEYFPSDFAARQNGIDAVPRSSDCANDFQWGLDRFIDEAQTLAKLEHPNIVRVFRYFRANSTAYMVLQFEEGQSFKAWLKGLGRAPRQSELDAIVAPLLDALEFIHKAAYLHRDVAPDNIIVRRDGVPVLIDFGSARGDIIAHSKTVSALVKPGYSPYEQYAETSRQQGPWTDIYALAATLYHAVTGRRPPDSPSRMIQDEYVSAREAAVGGYRAGFLKAIDKALLLQVDARPSSIPAWRGDLLAPDPVRQGWFSRGRGARRDSDALELAGYGSVAGAGAVPGVVVDGSRGGLQGRPADPHAHGFAPPPPDAPGAQGGLLDFVDRLKGRPADGPAPQPASPVKASAPAARTPEKASDRDPGAQKRSAKSGQSSVAVRVQTARVKQAKSRAVGTKPTARARPGQKPPRKPAAVKKSIAPLGAVANEPAPKKTIVERSSPVRPKPIRIRGKSPRWVHVLQLAIALGLAGGAVAYQDRVVRMFGGLSPTAAVTAPADGPQLLREIKAHSGEVPGLAYNEDGRTIVSASRDATLKVWSAATGLLLKTLPLDNRSVTSLALAGRRVVSGSTDGTISLYDLDKGERTGVFKRNDAEVWSVAFLGGGDRFAAASHDYQTAVWDTRAPTAPQFTLEGHVNAVQAVAYSVHGPWIATGGADKTVRLYDADTHDLVRAYKGLKDFVSTLTFAPDGKWLAVGSLDGDIRVYSTSSGRLRFLLHGHKGKVAGLAFSANGDYLASAGEDGIVRLWYARKGRTYRALTGHVGGVTAIAFSPDSTRLASAGADGAIRLYAIPAAKDDD